VTSGACARDDDNLVLDLSTKLDHDIIPGQDLTRDCEFGYWAAPISGSLNRLITEVAHNEKKDGHKYLFVACDKFTMQGSKTRVSYRHGAFSSHARFVTEFLQGNHPKCFHEIVLSGRPFKMYFDLDDKNLDAPLTEAEENQRLNHFNRALKDILRRRYGNDAIRGKALDSTILKGSRQTNDKYNFSFHVVMTNVFCNDWHENKNIAKEMSEKLNFVDTNVYGSIHQMRMAGCWKSDDATKTAFTFYKKDSVTLLDVLNSLITYVPDTRMIDDWAMKDHVQPDDYETDDESEEAEKEEERPPPKKTRAGSSKSTETASKPASGSSEKTSKSTETGSSKKTSKSTETGSSEKTSKSTETGSSKKTSKSTETGSSKKTSKGSETAAPDSTPLRDQLTSALVTRWREGLDEHLDSIKRNNKSECFTQNRRIFMMIKRTVCLLIRLIENTEKQKDVPGFTKTAEWKAKELAEELVDDIFTRTSELFTEYLSAFHSSNNTKSQRLARDLVNIKNTEPGPTLSTWAKMKKKVFRKIDSSRPPEENMDDGMILNIKKYNNERFQSLLKKLKDYPLPDDVIRFPHDEEKYGFLAGQPIGCFEPKTKDWFLFYILEKLILENYDLGLRTPSAFDLDFKEYSMHKLVFTGQIQNESDYYATFFPGPLAKIMHMDILRLFAKRSRNVSRYPSKTTLRLMALFAIGGCIYERKSICIFIDDDVLSNLIQILWLWGLSSDGNVGSISSFVSTTQQNNACKDSIELVSKKINTYIRAIQVVGTNEDTRDEYERETLDFKLGEMVGTKGKNLPKQPWKAIFVCEKMALFLQSVWSIDDLYPTEFQSSKMCAIASKLTTKAVATQVSSLKNRTKKGKTKVIQDKFPAAVAIEVSKTDQCGLFQYDIGVPITDEDKREFIQESWMFVRRKRYTANRGMSAATVLDPMDHSGLDFDEYEENLDSRGFDLNDSRLVSDAENDSDEGPVSAETSGQFGTIEQLRAAALKDDLPPFDAHAINSLSCLATAAGGIIHTGEDDRVIPNSQPTLDHTGEDDRVIPNSQPTLDHTGEDDRVIPNSQPTLDHHWVDTSDQSMRDTRLGYIDEARHVFGDELDLSHTLLVPEDTGRMEDAIETTPIPQTPLDPAELASATQFADSLMATGTLSQTY
jgi:hypothetical protein